AFGGALIAAGEWLRRRHGDEGETTTLYLPSVFSGAGLVSIFAATLAARHMYGLITPEVAFAGHLFTAALAVALGWFYGPLLAAVGLTGFDRRPISALSGGQMQRVMFARLLLQDADLILLDEPFTALDTRTAGELLQVVKRWHGEGRTVLAVLHDLDAVRNHFPDTLLLAREKVAHGPTAQVLTAENLFRARQKSEAFVETAPVCDRVELGAA
ncbi:MAG: DUF2339 domain-containing protein, partial [Rhodobacterales bacterium]